MGLLCFYLILISHQFWKVVCQWSGLYTCHEGIEGKCIYLFLPLAIHGVEWSKLHLSCFSLWGRGPGRHWMGGLMGTTVGLDILQKRRITALLLLGLKLRISQLAAHSLYWSQEIVNLVSGFRCCSINSTESGSHGRIIRGSFWFMLYSVSKLWCVHNILNCTSSIRSEVYEDYLSEKSGNGCGNSNCNGKIGGSMFCFWSVFKQKPCYGFNLFTCSYKITDSSSKLWIRRLSEVCVPRASRERGNQQCDTLWKVEQPWGDQLLQIR
jgi:hypothetical protein